jgi:hypothetical protein
LLLHTRLVDLNSCLDPKALACALLENAILDSNLDLKNANLDNGLDVARLPRIDLGFENAGLDSGLDVAEPPRMDVDLDSSLDLRREE